ncbi:MAG: YXWGXW repeat-containing protein [Burkholderiaceae bacterium]|jgi:hypothetical protein|nr:YXWGXW repeat-containing protein [Burkholderiaceae bacterium]
MKKLAVTLAIGAASALTVGAAVVVPTTATAQPVIALQMAPPPPPRQQMIPPPRRGFVWVPGHYRWNGRRHVWVNGTWLRARPGQVYRAPEWRERNGRWEYQGGRWDRHR